MKRLLFASAAALALSASPAAAASLVVTFGSTTAIPGNNNFATQLAGEGLANYATTGATISLSGPAKITFTFMGSESGFSDTFTFTADSFTGSNFMTEMTNGLIPWGAVPIGQGTYNTGGSLAGLLNFTSDQGVAAGIGADGFGIFLGSGAMSGDSFTTLFLGYDDQLSTRLPPDDNHDDFIVRMTVSAIPEPATWAMMIGGFGLVGASIRRRGGARRIVTA